MSVGDPFNHASQYFVLTPFCETKETDILAWCMNR